MNKQGVGLGDGFKPVVSAESVSPLVRLNLKSAVQIGRSCDRKIFRAGGKIVIR